MELLDEQGRVFGRINVIDLLAVLFALAVVVAGVTLVFSGGPSESPNLESRYVTLDLGTQPGYVTERIDAGDVASLPNSPENLTLTDVYVAPAEGPSAVVTVRARVTGQRIGEPNGGPTTVTYAGEPLILGRQLTVETTEYRLSGVVTNVDRSSNSLPVSTTDVLVTATLPADALTALSVGDQYRENGQTLATVETMTVYPSDNPENRRVHLGLSLRTLTRQGRTQFGTQAVGLGQTLSIPFQQYSVNGEVTQVGQASPPGDVTTTTAVLKLSNVGPERSKNVREGMTETVGETQYARVTDVRTEPSEVVLTSQDGNISLREHPRNVDLYLTVELRTRLRQTRLDFHGQPLRLNDEVTLDLGLVTIRGSVIEVRR